MIGAIAATTSLSVGKSSANALGAVGLALVVASNFLLHKGVPFPSFYALAPTVGTALILKFATSETLVARILSVKPLVGIGLISYSAYLWHQPLFAFARMATIGKPTLTVMLTLCFVTFALAYLTWSYIESPFRRHAAKGGFHRRQIFVLSGVGAVMLTVIGMAAWKLSDRISPYSAHHFLAAANARHDEAEFYACLGGTVRGINSNDPCTLGLRAKPSLDFLLVGDSVGASYGDGLSLAASKYGLRGAILATSGCTPGVGLGGTWQEAARDCERLQDSMFAEAKRLGVKYVILAGAWRALRPGAICLHSRVNCSLRNPDRDQVAARLKATISRFRANGAHVALLTAPPIFGVDGPSFAMKTRRFSQASYRLLPQQPSELEDLIKRAYPKPDHDDMMVIDVSPAFCSAKGCALVENDVPVMWDAFHITRKKSVALAPIYDELFSEMQKARYDLPANAKAPQADPLNTTFVERP